MSDDSTTSLPSVTPTPSSPAMSFASVNDERPVVKDSDDVEMRSEPDIDSNSEVQGDHIDENIAQVGEGLLNQVILIILNHFNIMHKKF